MPIIHSHATSLTIANGQTTSNALVAVDLKCASKVAIYGPATLPETVTVKVSNNSGSTYATLTSGGSNVTVGAGAVVFVDVGFDNLRLEAGGAVGAERVFTTQIIEDV